MDGQHVRHIHIIMDSSEQEALGAIQGENLDSLAIDELVGSVAVIDLVTSRHRIRIKNLQYEQPLKEDGRDYPCLSAAEADGPVEECRSVPVGGTVVSAALVRDRAVWKYEGKEWSILCDTGICIRLEDRVLLIRALDSDEGALAWKIQKEYVPEEEAPFDWKNKTKNVIRTERELISAASKRV